MIDGKPDFTKLKEITLDELARRYRMQKIVFEAASEVYDMMEKTWKGNREYLLAPGASGRALYRSRERGAGSADV